MGVVGDELKELVQMGYDIKHLGGTFEYRLDDNNQLSSFVIQTLAMREYAEAYSDFTLHDGTHGVNRYGEICVPT